MKLLCSCLCFFVFFVAIVDLCAKDEEMFNDVLIVIMAYSINEFYYVYVVEAFIILIEMLGINM